MKTISYRMFLTGIIALMLFAGCGQQAGNIALDTEGYGRASLANGITVLINHDETTSLTAARILIGGGVMSETAENNGITNLMIKMLLKGNEVMTATEVTDRLDFLGASVTADCYRDYSAISVVSLTENFNEVMRIVGRSLIAPTFPEDELGKLKHEVIGDIMEIDEDLSQASSKLFWATVYGEQGYGLSTNGTEESIAGITAGDIRAHYEKYVGGANVLFSIATDLMPERIVAVVQEHLGGLKKEATSVGTVALTGSAQKDGFIPFDRNQSFVYMGYALPHLQPREMACVILLNEIMGNNVGSRLWYLRQTEKLAYSVYTQYIFNKNDAVFRAAIGTDTSKVKIALASLNREMDSLVRVGITEGELADAKINMKNHLIYGIDRKSTRANNMAYYEYIGCTYRTILDLIELADQISLDEVNAFVKTNLTDDRHYVSIVGRK
ncbi:MAG: insulinase family protein [candidate division Zixibacteria bacterium]|nr:insulinase family protein [candidate division Zixibacteria bacterium]